jgi:shikimate dehydrogenase
MIDAKTKLFISVSSKPGMLGAQVYNYIFQRQEINALYLPRVAPKFASELITAIKTLDIQGCSVSMPLKQLVMTELDSLAESAKVAASVNTIVNQAGVLTGHSTDYLGAYDLFKHRKIKRALIFGAGGVVGAVVAALKEARVEKILVCARRDEAAQHLAAKLLIDAIPLTQAQRGEEAYDIFINATPAGWISDDISELTPILRDTSLVFDLAPCIEATAVVAACRKEKKEVLTGIDLFKAQVRHQCHLYTGYLPEIAEINAALEAASS